METNKKYINASTAYRNHSAKMLKTLRNLYPYKPENYSEAKEMYESYLKQGMITSFENLKVGDWVTALDNHAPVKGKRFAEYYVNYNSEGNVGEAYQIEKFYNYGETVSVADSDMGLMLGQFRKATDEEIATKIKLVRERKIAEIKNTINSYQKYINELNEKLATYEL
ncbi:MAG: hypothetical protein WC979_02820 [Candidatus Pacearchaeota archaeon]|jgi:hypothetical protein|nr:hypothetical protein [Clostridia bacterium]